MRTVITWLVSGLFLPGTFHAAAAAATPTVLSPTAGMTTFPIHGAVTQPTVFSPNALQPFAGLSSHTLCDLFNPAKHHVKQSWFIYSLVCPPYNVLEKEFWNFVMSQIFCQDHKLMALFLL